MSFSDSNVLTGDPTFQGRVGSALWTYCAQVVPAETVASTAGATFVHAQRKTYARLILNNPSIYRPFFVNSVSVDTTVVADATANSTVVLTTGNVATQQALITDTHLSNAVAATFNSFIDLI